MALIKCPECGKEISNQAQSCPNCGYPIEESAEHNENLESIPNHDDCPNDDSVNDAAESETSQGNENTMQEDNGKDTLEENPDSNINVKKGNKKLIIGIVVGIIVLIGIIGIAVSSHNAKVREEQEAEIQAVKEYNDYIDCFNELYNVSYEHASKAESVCVLTVNVWSNKIYKQYSEETYKYTSGASDFNEAIQNVYNDSDIQDKLEKIKSAQSKIDSLIVELQSTPNELEKCYDAAMQVYSSFNALANLALSPSGSLQSYRTEEQDKVDAYINAVNTYKALIPAKKDVPYFDEELEAIAKQVEFTEYLNQSIDKMPDGMITDNSLVNMGYVTGEAEISGIKGKMSYFLGNGSIVESERFETEENQTEEDYDKILAALEKLYGEGDAGEDEDAGRNCSWYVDKSVSVLLKQDDDDDSIIISWMFYYNMNQKNSET